MQIVILKPIRLPLDWLELFAAHLLLQTIYISSTRHSLNVKFDKILFWTVSTLIHIILVQFDQNVCFASRDRHTIRNRTTWHIDSSDNPADLISCRMVRGYQEKWCLIFQLQSIAELRSIYYLRDLSNLTFSINSLPSTALSGNNIYPSGRIWVLWTLDDLLNRTKLRSELYLLALKSLNKKCITKYENSK